MSRVDSFQTICKPGEGLYKEKGSKFIGVAFGVNSEDEIKDRLEELRKQYYDARHHCYAFVLGPDKGHYRANDDGEPNHSAGDPILGQINSKGLTNTLVVVIRYFGGTKLGVSGLIHAYKTAAEEALNNAEVTRVDITAEVLIDYPYESTNEVMRLVSDFELKITDQVFESKCKLRGDVKISKLPAFKDKVQLLRDTGYKLEVDFTSE